MILTLYIPSGDSLFGVVPGSAIVGQAEGPDQILCYYEGNLYGSEDLKRYRERVIVAAGRLVEQYPTIARITVPKDLVRGVAKYDTERKAVTDVVDEPALEAWSGEPAIETTGYRLPLGSLDVSEPSVRKALENLRPIKREGFRSLWRTIAGQIVEHRADRPQPFEIVEE